MKGIFLALLFVFSFVGCNTSACKCDPCKCTDCDCSDEVGQRVAPVDDSHRAYLTVYGVKGDPTYDTFCQWGRQTQGTHYAEITTDMQMAERMAGVQAPRVLITDSTGKTLYKGAPKTYVEFRSIFNRNCPDGNCRPRPEPAPTPAPVPVQPAPILQPIPDTDDGEAESNMPPWWAILLVVLGAGGVGYATWHKQEYFTS